MSKKLEEDYSTYPGSDMYEGTTEGSNSASLAGSTAARIAKDRAIINLWNAMRDLSDYGEEALTEQDLQLWGYVTGHDVVQSHLDQS